ncbi:citrate synthase [Rubinisphaera margarita]|uniref:citrate synthase n=1 Tax=Rubinisphaera margarita TaxID=2909586 RepID=UPI001EE97D5C|nr:citrate synthase [Rubinisphaera margarita]MCG6154831.1 citrate synthase [Rubinisphaera margarita]
MTTTTAKGLKNIVAADSSVSHVDGQSGQLIYRGYHIDELAERSTFEETGYLLLNGELPTDSQLKDFSDRLKQVRTVPEEVLALLKSLPADAHPMSMLRTGVSLLGNLNPAEDKTGQEAMMDDSLKLTAQIGTLLAAIKRIKDGDDPIAPDQTLSHAANCLYMMNGEKPSADAEKAMDLVLILHAEHGLNASTFAARVIAATLTDMYSSITGAIGALKGPLHGGANTAVLETLKEVDTVENVAPWVEKVSANKGKFMGFGHAVYQTQDPRAKHLKELSRRLSIETGEPKWYDMSIKMEELVTAKINKNCNVDFYSASLQYYMGIPGYMFTCVFAASRVLGWCAHVIEQLSDNKIIRPKANYVGYQERPYVAMSDRK